MFRFAITSGYNNMRDKFKDFLEEFAKSGKVRSSVLLFSFAALRVPILVCMNLKTSGIVCFSVVPNGAICLKCEF